MSNSALRFNTPTSYCDYQYYGYGSSISFSLWTKIFPSSSSLMLIFYAEDKLNANEYIALATIPATKTIIIRAQSLSGEEL